MIELKGQYLKVKIFEGNITSIKCKEWLLLVWKNLSENLIQYCIQLSLCSIKDIDSWKADKKSYKDELLLKNPQLYTETVWKQSVL